MVNEIYKQLTYRHNKQLVLLIKVQGMKWNMESVSRGFKGVFS